MFLSSTAASNANGQLDHTVCRLSCLPMCSEDTTEVPSHPGDSGQKSQPEPQTQKSNSFYKTPEQKFRPTVHTRNQEVRLVRMICCETFNTKVTPGVAVPNDRNIRAQHRHGPRMFTIYMFYKYICDDSTPALSFSRKPKKKWKKIRMGTDRYRN